MSQPAHLVQAKLKLAARTPLPLHMTQIYTLWHLFEASPACCLKDETIGFRSQCEFLIHSQLPALLSELITQNSRLTLMFVSLPLL